MSSPAPESETHEATFARDLGLFDASMIGTGAMIGAGIFVLTGLAAGEAGPASILAFALNGVVTLLTAFAYAELASAIPQAGGGYSFVRRAFPGAIGFTAGWMLWFAYTVACSLYALGFAGYFWEFFLKYMPGLTQTVFGVTGEHLAALLITVLIAVIFIRLNIRGAAVTGMAENVLTVSKIVVLFIFIGYGLRRIFQVPERVTASFTPFFPHGFGGVIVSMGLTFIAFEGYDLIATVAEEIKEPEKNIPRATFFSLGIAIVIYLLILFVAMAAVNPPDMPSWQFLGKYQETAIVRAAEEFMPAFGVALIVFGGLLSTLSALNATVMAASRVAFSLGRDKLLPQQMAVIDPVRRTPKVAIIVTGVILLLMALTLPLAAVGSAASLIFLLTFAMVNLSLIVLRRKEPDIPRRYRVPLYPVVPILAIVLNLFLAVYQFSFQPVAWYVTIGWVIFGLLLYFAYFEKQAAGEQPQVLVPRRAVPVEAAAYTVVVPLHNPAHVRTLLGIGTAMARERGGRVIAVAVVNVPQQLPVHEGMRFLQQKEPLLELARQYGAEHGMEIGTDLIIAHRIQDGILAAARNHAADLLVMGWKGFTNTRERLFGEVTDQVIRHAPCDLMVLKSVEGAKFRSALFPTAGGPHAQLAAEFLGDLADELDMSVTAAYVVPPDASAEAKAKAEGWMDEALASMDGAAKVDKRLLTSNSVPRAIAQASRDYDLLVIGAAKEPLFRQVLFGEIPEKIARESPTSVLVVKRYEGAVKSMLKKAIG